MPLKPQASPSDSSDPAPAPSPEPSPRPPRAEEGQAPRLREPGCAHLPFVWPWGQRPPQNTLQVTFPGQRRLLSRVSVWLPRCPRLRGMCGSRDVLQPCPPGDAQPWEAEVHALHNPPCPASVSGPPRTGVSGGPAGVFTVAAVWKGRQHSDSEDQLAQLDRGWDRGQRWSTPAGLPSRSRCGAARGPCWSCRDAPPRKGTEDTLGFRKDSRVA